LNINQVEEVIVMAMMRYEPFEGINQLQREINRLFESPGYRGNGETGLSASDWAPAVDIREEPDAFVLSADVPGVDPKDIEVTMEQGVLTLKGERAHDKEEEKKGFRRVERVRGSFLRRFTLPDTVDPDQITARTNNGVLEIRVPKGEKAQPRRIEIQG